MVLSKFLAILSNMVGKSSSDLVRFFYTFFANCVHVFADCRSHVEIILKPSKRLCTNIECGFGKFAEVFPPKSENFSQNFKRNLQTYAFLKILFFLKNVLQENSFFSKENASIFKRHLQQNCWQENMSVLVNRIVIFIL